MASVFKLGRDKKKKNAPWYFEYQDHLGKKRMRKGFTEKSLTEQLAVKMETEARMRRLGFIDEKQAALADEQKSDVEPQIKEYERTLKRRKNSPKYVSLAVGRIRRIVSGCGFQTLGDISDTAVDSYMAKLCEAEGLGHRTHNHYLQAIEGFCNWLVKKHRLAANPVRGIDRLNNATDVRHPRRALLPSEFAKLVRSAEESGVSIQCYDGQTRGRIYVLSYMTGLRRSELASLTPRSFNLRGKPPTLTVEATISKHRRKDVLPLHPELVASLREWLKGLGPDDPLFPNLAKRRTWLMVKKDLERVGIPYQTEEGIADFHAAGRHTHITELLRNGASLPEAKELARHTDVKMTMRYAHIGIEDQARALRGLPMPKSCQDIVRKPAVSGCPGLTSDGDDWRKDSPIPQVVTPAQMAASGVKRQKKTPPVTGGVEWRRRESNQNTRFPKCLRSSKLRRRQKKCLHYVCTAVATPVSVWRHPIQFYSNCLSSGHAFRWRRDRRFTRSVSPLYRLSRAMAGANSFRLADRHGFHVTPAASGNLSTGPGQAEVLKESRRNRSKGV